MTVTAFVWVSFFYAKKIMEEKYGYEFHKICEAWRCRDH